jgi:hypothetical protein
MTKIYTLKVYKLTEAKVNYSALTPTSLFQIIKRFVFSRYIIFVMYSLVYKRMQLSLFDELNSLNFD